MFQPQRAHDNPTIELAFAPRSIVTQRSPGQGRRAVAQARRRHVILAAARGLLAEGGLEGINIRTLARRSGVTPPTIYNLVGAREDVVLKAMREGVEGIAAVAARRAQSHGINEIMAYCHTVALSLAADPDYFLQIDHAAALTPKGNQLILFFENLLRCIYSNWLRAMKARGDIKQSPVDLDVVTSILVQQQISTALTWARGEIDVDDYRRLLISGAGLVLLGIVTPREAPKIELWLAQFLKA